MVFRELPGSEQFHTRKVVDPSSTGIEAPHLGPSQTLPYVSLHLTTYLYPYHIL